MGSRLNYGYSEVDMRFVYQEPEEFIIPENLEACKLLWSKNIFTKMCNNYDNDFSWITFNCLSPENQKIFDDLSLVDERFGSTWGGIGLRIPIRPGMGIDTYEAFGELIDSFEYQDVQKDGCMDYEEFMRMYTDCYKIIDNPNYKYIPKPKLEDYEDGVQYSRAFDEYIDSTLVPMKLRVFDESKMTKSFEEYLEESKFKGLYDPDNRKVYYNDLYYQAHMRYKEQMKTPKLN